MAYTGEEVDSIVVKLERSAEKCRASATSAVRLTAAERDLLKAAEAGRDLLLKAVKGDKGLLEQVFGGTCERIHRLRQVLNEIVFSNMHASDVRWNDLRNVVDSIESVLKQLGLYKPWQPPKLQPPTNLQYKACKRRFNPGEQVSMKPEFEGAEAAEFVVEPPLPNGLELDSQSGAIRGTLRRNVEYPETTYIITATNEVGSGTVELTFAVSVEPPSAVTYPDIPSQCYTGEAVCWEPASSGGKPTDWASDPELPKGLKLDPASGVIMGVPLEGSEPSEYTIAASNTGGQASVAVKLEVQVAPPELLTYPEARQAYGIGEDISIVPEVKLKQLKLDSTLDKLVRAGSEQASSLPPMRYAIEPALFEGLTLDESTGVISGRALQACEEIVFQVTIANDGGETTMALPLSIQMTPPACLSYPSVAETYFVGEPIELAPKVEGVVERWSVEPEFQQGLTLDVASGIVSGTPIGMTVAGSGSWTVVAGNSAGDCSTELAFQVIQAPPRGLEYPDFQGEYAFKKPFEINPRVNGEVAEYSISPALPLGIQFDTKTGCICGTPEELSEASKFEVTATNSSGSTTVEISFGVKLMPPDILCYAVVAADSMYTVGEEMAISPEVQGGPTSFSVEPSLPLGMVLDPADGRISGIPEERTAETSYVVTAANDAGIDGKTFVLKFATVAPAPESISYPGAVSAFTLEEEVLLEPEIVGGDCSDFVVSPSLPVGLLFDKRTGIMSGSPTSIAELATYKITAKNFRGAASVELDFECAEPPELEVTQAFAARIEEITEVAELMEEPTRETHLGDWMIWMVHRAWLNDPTLVELNFSNMTMPPPHVEERIAPKLMKAMLANTNMKKLVLPNANLQKQQGHQLAEALKVNTTLEVLNVETNNLDSDSIKCMAEGLRENKKSVLAQWRFSYQKGVGGFFGRPLEESIGGLMATNDRIIKLGFACNDPNWRDSIDRALLRNNDFARRRRRKSEGDYVEEILAEEKSLGKVSFKSPPERPISDFFDEADEHLHLVQGYVAKTKRMPVAAQLQSIAKSNGTPLKYSTVAPLLKKFHTKIFDSAVGSTVTVFDECLAETTGILRAWSEKNGTWKLDVWPARDARFNYIGKSQPAIEVSDEFASWLQPQN